jgi:hypothetical protein
LHDIAFDALANGPLAVPDGLDDVRQAAEDAEE